MKLLTTTEASNILGVSVNTVKKYIKDGLLTAYRPAGTRYKIPEESVKDFLEKSLVTSENKVRIKEIKQ